MNRDELLEAISAYVQDTSQKLAVRHTVVAGETVASVAEMHGVTAAALRRYNNMPADQEVLAPGREVLVPRWGRFLDDALQRLDRDRPGEMIADLVGPGTELALPAEWVDGFSHLREVEHPVGQLPPARLGVGEYALVRSPGGTMLRLRSRGAGVVRVTLTRPHAADAEGTTLPWQLRQTAIRLAAGYACQALAAVYSNDTSSSFKADHVNQGSNASAYGARAKAYLEAAEQDLRTEQDEVRPAGGYASWAPERPSLTHG